jgi:hypothetical protein
MKIFYVFLLHHVFLGVQTVINLPNLLAIPAISETSGVNCMQNFKTLKLVAIQMICVFLKQNDGFIKIY